MMFSPKWSKLSANIKLVLSEKEISELEKLRKELKISHEPFFLAVSASSEFGKRIIEQDYRYLKTQYPEMSEKKILSFLLKNEGHAMELLRESGQSGDANIENLMRDIKNVRDLCNMIIFLEHKAQPVNDDEVSRGIEFIIKKG